MIRNGLLAVVLCFPATATARAQDGPPKPIGQFLTVRSPIDDTVTSRIRNVALDLAGKSERDNRPAVLVLEITPGASPFHHVQGLAALLSSVRLARVRTVAWIPETVTGNKVVVALACNEIVLHPDAELGDISLGEALEDSQRQFIQSLVEKRLNPKVNWPLARGMLDRNAEVIKVTIKGEKDPAGSRILNPKNLALIRENNPNATIEVDTIKESGSRGAFSGQQARALDILAVQTAEARAEVATIYGLPRRSMREERNTGTEPIARLIKINDMIEPTLQAFFNRQIQRAIADKANLLIFEIDSPGGLLTVAETMANDIASLEDRNIRTVAWIPREAISGAAIIALGCDEIYMHPEARIGDAAPIEMKPGMPFERAPEKVLSYTREVLRTLAEKKGRPPGIAEAMADKDLEVFQVVNRETGDTEFKTEAELHGAANEFGDKQRVPETRRDNLLTVNGRRAHELSLAEPPVAGIEELKQRLGLPAQVVLRAVQRTWVDNLAIGLSGGEAAFLLFFFGSILIYLELYTMTGLCGIGASLCFALFFWARWGQTAGWLEVVLFLLGLALIALEIFLIPGFGVFGVSGGLLVFASLIMASETMVGSVSMEGLARFERPTITLIGSLITVLVAATVISRYLPSMPLLKHIVLEPPSQEEISFDPRLAGQTESTALLDGDHSLIGQSGTAVSVLRPSGKARFGEDLVDVISDGPFINPDTAIEVVRIEGNRVMVRQLEG